MNKRIVQSGALAMLLLIVILTASQRPSTAPLPLVTENPAAARLVTSPYEWTAVPLLPNVNWYIWYQLESGFTPSPTLFGPYVLLPMNDDLLIGLGSARPAESDGALVGVTDSVSLHSLGAIPEQGIHEMRREGPFVHIGGTDPCCADDWTAGNHYLATAVGPIYKHRDAVRGLVNVVHTFGLWVEEATGNLYAAVSAQEYQVVWHGQVWRSQDQGQTWQLLSNIGTDRAYDIVGFKDKLYVLYTNLNRGERNTLAVSQNGGYQWKDLVVEDFQRLHLIVFGELLVGVSYDRTAVYTIDAAEAITRYNLPPGAKIGVSYKDIPSYTNYNILTTDGRYLYTVLETASAKKYSVARTTDLETWEILYTTDRPILTLAYWPAKNWLVWGDNGRFTTLWKLPLPPSLPTGLWQPTNNPRKKILGGVRETAVSGQSTTESSPP